MPRSAKVAAYADYLTGRQSAVASSVGAIVQNNSTLASNSFTARLTGRQATELSTSRDVLMIVEDEAFQLDTYKSPEFLGLAGPNGQWAKNGGVAKAGAGVVVGVLDSGIWPESGSFQGSKLDRNPTGPFEPVPTWQRHLHAEGRRHRLPRVLPAGREVDRQRLQQQDRQRSLLPRRVPRQRQARRTATRSR